MPVAGLLPWPHV